MNPPRPLRAAIYTRKSVEEGLEQAFNSLDAQREACAAYIKSQVHEGWRPVKTSYADGGSLGAGQPGREPFVRFRLTRPASEPLSPSALDAFHSGRSYPACRSTGASAN